MSNKKEFYDNPKKLIISGLVFMLIGLTVPFLWMRFPDFAGGLIFGSGLTYLFMGMQKHYNKK